MRLVLLIPMRLLRMLNGGEIYRGGKLLGIQLVVSSCSVALLAWLMISGSGAGIARGEVGAGDTIGASWQKDSHSE